MRNRIRRTAAFVVLVLVVLGLSPLAHARVLWTSASVSQVVGSKTFPAHTLEVTIVASTTSNTCFYELVTDADTPVTATTASLPIAANESHAFKFTPGQGTEGFVGNVKATRYKTLSFICSTGQTATWRVIYK